MESSSNQVIPVRRPSKVSRIFWTIFFLVVAALGIYLYWKYFFTYSEGNRYGLLQKFSRRGNLFKTYEGELILSSIRGNANVPIASEKFYFSVDNKNTATKLANLQGRYITVQYKEKNGALLWRGDSRYIVDSVKVEKGE